MGWIMDGVVKERIGIEKDNSIGRPGADLVCVGVNSSTSTMAGSVT